MRAVVCFQIVVCDDNLNWREMRDGGEEMFVWW